MPELDDVIQQLRKRLNLSTVIGYLGDGSGEVHNRTRPGYYYVRFRQANSTFTAPVSLRAHPNANLPDMDGLAVVIGYDPSGDQIILEVFSPGIDAAGINPLALNPLDSTATKLKPQSDVIPSFLCTQHADRTNKPLYVVVFPGFIVASTNLTYFPGAELDLSSLVPIAGQHRYVVVCIKSDYATLEAVGSTAKDLDDPLSDDDIEEAYLTRTSGSIAIWAWELRDAQTVLDSDPTKQVDLRLAISNFVGVTDHGFLSGLADDDHTQYALLAGRSGGQVLIGGTASGEDLTLVSTSHVTKGSIYFGAAGALGELTSAGKLILVDSLDAGNVGYATLDGAIVGDYLGIGVAPTTAIPVNIASTLTPASGALLGVEIITTYNPAGASTATNSALLVVGQTQSGNAQTFTNLYGIQAQSDHYGTDTLTTGVALLGKATNRSSGTLSNGYGLLTQVYNLGAGTLTNAYGVFVDNPANTGGGTLVNATGIYIDNQGLSGMTVSKGIEIAAQSGATTSHALLIHDSLVTFNEDGTSGGTVRMEGDTDTNLFRTDPATDSVLLGTSTAVSGLKLLVSGAQRVTSFFEQSEQSAPSTPASGFGRWYVSTSGVPRFINDAGTDSDLTAGGGSGDLVLISDSGIISSSQANFDFTSIPATYDHLLLILQLRSDSAGADYDEARIRFNNDSGSVYYSLDAIFAHSAAFGTVETIGGTSGYAGRVPGATSPSGWVGAMALIIPRYANASYKKSFGLFGFAPRSSSSSLVQALLDGTLWDATAAAINRITVFPQIGSNFVAGSSISLYGLN